MWILAILALALIGGFVSIGRRREPIIDPAVVKSWAVASKPASTPMARKSGKVRVMLAVGNRVSYPDANGRYQNAGEIIRISGGVAQLHCGHPNNSPFPRPLTSLRLAA